MIPIIIWLLCGLIGGFMIWRTEKPDHMTLSHAAFIAICMGTGPLALSVASVAWLINHGDDIVLWRRKP